MVCILMQHMELTMQSRAVLRLHLAPYVGHRVVADRALIGDNNHVGKLHQGDKDMTFSKETMEKTMRGLTEEGALRMIALAGGREELRDTVEKLAATFNVRIPEDTFSVILRASRRYNKAFGRMVA